MEHPHPETALYDVGRKLYTSALRTGLLSHEATGSALCLIDTGLLRALDGGTEEFLAIQPASGRTNRTAEKIRATAQRVRELHERGIAQRTLYNHTYRHRPATLAYLDGLKDAGLEVRTMEETAEKLVIIDRLVALGSANRTQLGYLIARSGMLEGV